MSWGTLATATIEIRNRYLRSAADIEEVLEDDKEELEDIRESMYMLSVGRGSFVNDEGKPMTMDDIHSMLKERFEMYDNYLREVERLELVLEELKYGECPEGTKPEDKLEIF